MSQTHLPEIVYTPESQLGSPGKLLRAMFRDLGASRQLAWWLFVRDFRAQYRQTAFGYLWAVFPPLVTSLLFIFLNSSKVMRIAETGIPYPAYVVMGTVFFGLFMDALNAPLKAVNAARSVLVKLNFPREALLLAALGQVLFSFAIKLVLLIATLIIFRVPIQPTALLAAVPLAGLLVMGMMLGLLLVPVGMLFQDVSHALSLAGTGIMFLTPVVYPLPTQGLLATLTAYNPLTSPLMCAREYVVQGWSAYTVSMMVTFLVALVLLLAAWVLFRLALPIIVERIGT